MKTTPYSNRLVSGILVLLIFSISGGVTGFFHAHNQTKTFAASCVVKDSRMEPRGETENLLLDENGCPPDIFSREVLQPVIRAYQLQENLAPVGAGQAPLTEEGVFLLFLREHLHIKPYRHTSLLEVQVIHTDPRMARDLANAVAESYSRHRAREDDQKRENGIAFLQAEFKKQAAICQKAREELQNYKQDPEAGQKSDLIAKLKGERDKQLSLLELLKLRLDEELKPMAHGFMPSSVEIVNIAELPSRPICPNVPLTTLWGALAGFILGTIAAGTWIVAGMHPRDHRL